MGSNPTQSGSTPPPKPWERAGTSSGPAPFKPPSSGSTSDIVEASGTAKPGEVVASAQGTVVANRNTLARPIPPRPWEQNYGNTYGGYGSSMNYNSGYGSGVNYNSVGGFGGGFGGGSLGGGMYGTMNNRGYGGLYGGSGMYGGGSMYNNSGFGGQMGGYGMGMGMGMGGGNYGDQQDPNNPYGAPPSPPGFWMSFLRMMNGVVNIFGRISILVDQNTQAFHMFMTALLQLFDRSGVLYGELARFVLRILGIRFKPKMHQQELLGSNGQEPPPPQQQHLIQGPKAPIGAWDSVWENEGPK